MISRAGPGAQRPAPPWRLLLTSRRNPAPGCRDLPRLSARQSVSVTLGC